MVEGIMVAVEGITAVVAAAATTAGGRTMEQPSTAPRRRTMRPQLVTPRHPIRVLP
jgi:hypothetical protein